MVSPVTAKNATAATTRPYKIPATANGPTVPAHSAARNGPATAAGATVRSNVKVTVEGAKTDTNPMNHAAHANASIVVPTGALNVSAALRMLGPTMSGMSSHRTRIGHSPARLSRVANPGLA